MKTVGLRRDAPLSLQARADLLAEGARWNAEMAHLSKAAFIPKGIYRFKTHAAANHHERECLARALAQRTQSLCA